MTPAEPFCLGCGSLSGSRVQRQRRPELAQAAERGVHVTQSCALRYPEAEICIKKQGWQGRIKPSCPMKKVSCHHPQPGRACPDVLGTVQAIGMTGCLNKVSGASMRAADHQCPDQRRPAPDHAGDAPPVRRPGQFPSGPRSSSRARKPRILTGALAQVRHWT